MSWKAGDKAYCIKKGNWSPSADKGPRYGVIYLVTDVIPDRDGNDALYLCGFESIQERDGGGWHPKRFRKVVPQCDREEMTQEERITELIEIKYPNLA